MGSPVKGWRRKFADNEIVILRNKWMGVGKPRPAETEVKILRLDGVSRWHMGSEGRHVAHSAVYYVEEVGTGEVYATLEDEMRGISRGRR